MEKTLQLLYYIVRQFTVNGSVDGSDTFDNNWLEWAYENNRILFKEAVGSEFFKLDPDEYRNYVDSFLFVDGLLEKLKGISFEEIEEVSDLLQTLKKEKSC